MTRKEAIKRLKEIDIRDALQEDYDALDMAIKALEQEPKQDIGVYEREDTDWSGAQGNTIDREIKENERGRWGIYG